MSLCFILLAASIGSSIAATVNNEDALWPNGIIYYQYDSSVTDRLRSTVQEAMDVWEKAACLKFEPKTSNVTDYVVFHSYPNHQYCTCDSVGRRKGQQNIILGYSCQEIGELLHTLGHIIGLFHEQSRPDRDEYVIILTENIEAGEEERFVKIADLSIGYQGEGYDYASIMHLNAAAYAKGRLTTTEIANEQEYRAQGSPKLGERLRLSEGDIRRVNRLYSCRAVGQCEKLQVNIGSVQEVVSVAGLNHHVKVVAVDGNGNAQTLSTECIVFDDAQGEFNHVWNETLKFPVNTAKWRFFRISLLAEETLLSMVQTFPLEAGTHACVHHSVTEQQAELNFKYECIADDNDCIPSPCMSSTRCDDLLFNYTCHCLEGYGGKNCSVQCPRGYDGYNCDMDISGDSCSPNPCIAAHSISCVDGILDYTCNCQRGYGGKNCQLDISGDSCSPIPCVTAHTHNCVDGIFNYTCNCIRGYGGKNCQYDISGDSCSPSPCIPANTRNCIDGFYDYTCNCKRGWGGKNCEHDVSGNSCSPNPCVASHTVSCTDGFYDYTCNCRRGWGGKNCERDESGNSCSPSPCHYSNAYGCVDGFFDYTCRCKPGYSGGHCQTHRCSFGYCTTNGGTCSPYGYSPYYRCSCPLAWTSSSCGTWGSRCLQVVIKYARGLSDTDSGWFTGDSDPYTRITAYSTNGQRASAQTPYRQGDESPTWNYVFNADCHQPWDRFWFQVWDSDVGSDDRLSSGQYVYFSSLSQFPACSYTVDLIGGDGSITFDIFYYTPGGSGSPGSC